MTPKTASGKKVIGADDPEDILGDLPQNAHFAMGVEQTLVMSQTNPVEHVAELDGSGGMGVQMTLSHVGGAVAVGEDHIPPIPHLVMSAVAQEWCSSPC